MKLTPLIDSKIKLGLHRMRQGILHLNIREDQFNYILVGGTNGKGTTATFLGRIMELHGKKTMVYTSPHLLSPTERIRVNGEKINEEILEDYYREAQKLNERYRIGLTPFETFTLAAFMIAKDSSPEVFIAEVGLGGRLDATNVLLNRYAIITSVGIDHTEFLGSSLESIAWEKAHIIKKETTAITGNLPAEALRVIENRALLCRAKLLRWNREIQAKVTSKGLATEVFMETPFPFKATVETPFESIAHNAILAVVTASFLITSTDTKKLEQAIKKPPLPARGEVLKKDGTLVLIDTAHNPQAAEQLAKALKRMPKPTCAILSLLKDKEWRKFLDIIKESCQEVLLVEQPTARGIKRHDAREYKWIDLKEIPSKVSNWKGTVAFAGSFWMAKTAREIIDADSL